MVRGAASPAPAGPARRHPRPAPHYRRRRLLPKSPLKNESASLHDAGQSPVQAGGRGGKDRSGAASHKLTEYFEVERGGAGDAATEARPPARPGPAPPSRKLTEFYPVRRSVRKTSKCVQAERVRDLERAIREQREDGLQVAEVAGKGRGIVATREFPRGQFVVEYAGELVSPAEARARELRYALDPAAGCYMYYFRLADQQYCVDATAESGRLGRLVNHSRNGNLVTKALWACGGPRLVLLAARHIRVGDELAYDYGDRSPDSIRHHPWLAL